MTSVTAPISFNHTQHYALPFSLGRYELIDELGRGGMGTVYRAHDKTMNRTVALKILETENERMIALFEREYHILASLKHPCVIEVFDFALTADGRRYYTMELLEGKDLAALSPIPWQKACHMIRDVATSLALLHARRLLHRDVSPRNVRLDVTGRAKLLDFGALAPFGVAKEVVGTPTCMAPEVIRRLDLDQRADLYSLGAVVYWTLTGYKPYSMRHLADAEAAWRVRPVPPSHYVPEIPPALDQLIMSLININPLGRPASAAEVIERLGALTQLDETMLNGIAESHLLSSTMAGREREKEQLNRHINRALVGKGGLMVIESSAGMGRSRFINEALIDARLQGMTTLRVDALAHSEPGGMLRALARNVLEVAPAEAKETLNTYFHVLGKAFPDLRHCRISKVPVLEKKLSKHPAERRMQIQTALVDWLADVSERQPLLIAIDNAHAVDADSAGALVVLAHVAQHNRLVVVTTHLLGAKSPVAIQQLVRVGARIKLRGLSLKAFEQIVASILGDVLHRTRLVQWLHAASHGNPAQAFELLRNLIERKVIHYESGTWVLPAEFSGRDMPRTLEEALSTRLSRIGPTALKLARLFALHRGPISLPLCNRLLPEAERPDLYAALDELVARDLVVAYGESYRLVHEALRNVLTKSLNEDQARELHYVLGQALTKLHADVLEGDLQTNLAQANISDLGIALQAGWHLLHGGAADRGRDLLRNAGIELTHRGDGLAEAVPALEEALAAYRREGRSRYECSYLMVPLVLAGTYSDWRLSYRYGEELIDVLLEITGISRARRLARWLGGHLALGVSLILSAVLFRLTRRRDVARSYKEAFLGLMGLASAVIGTDAPLLDYDRSRKILDRLSPLGLFSRNHAVGLVHEFLIAMAEATYGRYSTSLHRGRRVLELMRSKKGIRNMSEDVLVQFEVGIYIMTGSLEVHRTDGSVHDTLRRLDELHSAVSRQTAAGIRAIYHATRGERTRFLRYQEDVDMLAAQAGSIWRQDVLSARTLWWAYAISDDVMGLKRTVRQLEALAAEVPSLADTRDAAIACYMAGRRQHKEALEKYSGMLERMSKEPTAIAMRFVGTYARVLRAAGQPERAREICETAFANLPEEELAFVSMVHGTRLELVLSIASLGNFEEAQQMIESWLDEQNEYDNPLIHGLTHKVAAKVALMQEDRDRFSKHALAMKEWFKRTENPALVAQCQKLADEAVRSGLIEDSRPYSEIPPPHEREKLVKIGTAFSVCRGPAERLQTAIDIILETTHAECGYLYLLEPDGLKFAAPEVGFEPPNTLLDELQIKVAEFQLANEEERTVEKEIRPTVLETVFKNEEVIKGFTTALVDGVAYRSLIMAFSRSVKLIVVGVIALVPGDEPIREVSYELVSEVARGIYDAGDVQTVYFGAPPTEVQDRAIEE